MPFDLDDRMFVFGTVGLLILQRVTELLISARNLRWALSQGGVEYGKEHYWMFVALHTGWLAGITVEAHVRGYVMPDWYWLPLSLALFAQVLRYWAIVSLGPRWNTRIVVIPGKRLVNTGPYRFMHHPNYVAVIIELATIPLIFSAYMVALIASVMNGLLLFCVRIPEENRALKQSQLPNGSLGES